MGFFPCKIFSPQGVLEVIRIGKVTFFRAVFVFMPQCEIIGMFVALTYWEIEIFL